MEWRHDSAPAEQVRALSRELGVSEILAELLSRAPGGTIEELRRFLDPKLADLGDPFALTNLDQAVDRVSQAIDRQEVVAVFGDYDVDGVTSTALLVSTLRRFGLQPIFVVPRRLEEGYGLSRDAIDRALEAGPPSLFVALDCGTNSVVEAEYLGERGIDVVIVDHHRSKDDVPPRAVLVNPHVHGDNAGGIADLCTVGLVFKLVHGLLIRRRALGDERAHAIRIKDDLDLVAMGTVADLVPLRHENRILARHGLRILGHTERIGLRTLMEVAGMPVGIEPRPVDVSFRLGPRINASGRLADAAVSVELLLSRDPVYCREAARQLDDFNRERQDIERQITELAITTIQRDHAGARGVVLFDDAWHSGVVGVVASRLARRYHLPCIVLGREGEFAKGSGRGVVGINLVEVLAQCSQHLESWGGHPMAVGVSLKANRVREFQAAFEQAVVTCAPDGAIKPMVNISAWIPLDAVHERLLLELDLLHPFGQQNPEPVFGTRNVIFDTPPEIFRDLHFRFSLHTVTGRRINGVAWNQAQNLPPPGVPVDIAYQIEWNYFNGRRYLQMELHAWRESSP